MQSLFDGRQRLKARNYTESARCAVAALQVDETLPGAHSLLGISRAMAGKGAEGIRECTTEVENGPEEVAPLYDFGYAYYLAKDPWWAKDAWQRALEIDPGYPDLRESLDRIRSFFKHRPGNEAR